MKARLAKARTGALFARNTVASIIAFAVDIALLWGLVEGAGVAQLPAAAVAFIVAISLQYLISRRWVFRGTERGAATGYVYFMLNGGIGLVVTLAAFALMTEVAGLHYLIARAIASVIAGLLVFVLNAVFNFKAV